MQRISSLPAKIGAALIVTAATGLLVRSLLRRRSLNFLRPSRVHIRPVSAVAPRGFTRAELKEFDGVRRPEVLVSVRRVVYEVAPQFYGPGQPYHVYAGHEITRCLATSDLTGREADKDWTHTCTPAELETLRRWEEKFVAKYPVVGWFVPEKDFYDTETAVTGEGEGEREVGERKN